MCRAKEKRADAMAHFEPCVGLYGEQLERGCWFLHEQPWLAASWNIEYVRTLLCMTGCFTILLTFWSVLQSVVVVATFIDRL